MPIAYDIGMHIGADTDYYLKKGYEVVAVEANPALCQQALARFGQEILDGRLKIYNLAIADQAGEMEFHVHNREAEWGTIIRPQSMEEWSSITVPCRPLSAIVTGEADLVKVDIEGADRMALDSLDAAGVFPGYISCRAHSVDVLCKLVCMGYTEFRLMNGKRARRRFRNHQIRTLAGETLPYAFGPQCSGPMGEDFADPWQNTEQIFSQWPVRGTLFGNGWYDVHARSKVGSRADRPGG